MNSDYYKSLYQISGRESERQKQQFNRCSFFRGCAALAACGFFLLGYGTDLTFYYFFGIAGVILFIPLVRQHSRIKEQQEYYADREAVSGEYIARTNNDWKEFKINGGEYLSKCDPKGRDLDIFGANSLYQYICTASTVYGQEGLASALEGEENRKEELEERQQAVSELAEKIEFSTRFQTLARPQRRNMTDNRKEIIEAFIQGGETRGKNSFLWKVFIWILPLTTMVFLGTAILGVHGNGGIHPVFFMVFLQLGISVIGARRNNSVTQPVYRFSKSISPYRKLAEEIEKEEFTSVRMQALQQRLMKNNSASKALKELEKISKAVAAHNNLFALFIYNCLFLYDSHCTESLLTWESKHHSQIEDWLKVIGEVETLVSLGVICQVKGVYTFPEIKNSEEPLLSAKDLRHPLIWENRAVGNDFKKSSRTCIITGSNMSGKTTLLRSIGVNLVLAYAGGPVTAQEFVVSPMKICTSMRVEDSVSEGISTFYAELLQIKNMIDDSRESIPMIALIDEIYKGTNSNDRIIGARETIRGLAKPNVFTVLTTHDFELCDLENDEAADVVNFHFTEHYTEKEIIFDYKMREGRCRTTNAQYLLRMVGILP